ncbi:hypothetical protein [Nocardioides sp. Iso805N]|uniref:hypothetical protein n=1 Tax=Nocardioides sp. Iso805N TaxID=1283287 RepID=UPI0003A6FE20|nr:hypothetical protein [Nocardioides sp. Iso805N]
MSLERRRAPGALPTRLLCTLAAASSAAFLVVGGPASGPASATAPSAHTSSVTSTTACPTSPTDVNTVPPNAFGPNVTIFTPNMSVTTINTALKAATTPARAPRQFFFMPGTYGDPTATPATATTDNTIQAEVASGTVVAGLGASPCDVVINGALDIPRDGLAIRPTQMENLTVNPIEAGSPAHTLTWFTSQNATLRRVNILGNLDADLATAITGPCTTPCTTPQTLNNYGGDANGFVVANSNITGKLVDTNGLNTQGKAGEEGNSDLYIQDSRIGGFTGFGSGIVFAGVIGAPADDFGPGTSTTAPGDVTNLATVPVVRESPFVYADAGTFKVFNPSARFNVQGYDWSTTSNGTSLPLSDVYLASAATDTAATINAALAGGQNVVLNPGAYAIESPIRVTKPDQMIFGLGEATLTTTNPTASIVVNDAATGTVLAGFNANGAAFDANAAGPFPANQIVIGNTPGATGSKTDPTTLSDISSVSGANTDELVNQNYVILNQAEIQTNNNSGDGYTTTNWVAQNNGEHGAIVNGDHVTFQGIWLEHFKKEEVIWHGNDGQVMFLQNEWPLTVPYDIPDELGQQPHVWKQSATFNGYPVLTIDNDVTTFALKGFQSWGRLGNGCYCTITSLITTPVKPGITFHGLYAGQILGSSATYTPTGSSTAVSTTPSGATVGGTLNMINHDGVSAYVPYDASWAGSSAWPHADLYGQGATARVRDFPAPSTTGPTTGPTKAPSTAPGKVTSLKVTGKKSATKRVAVWGAPASTGGATIKGYELIVKQSGRTVISRTLGAGTRRFAIKARKLTHGHTAKVEVRALNSVGAGAWTQVSVRINR